MGLAIAGIGSAQAADDVLMQGATLLKAGNSSAAYALLEPQEHARAGEKDFDLLMGIAALEVGQYTRAIFALERVLAVAPENARARVEIARAYLAVGELRAARAEFESARKMGVPDEVARNIDHFLSAVDRIENVGKSIVRGYIEGSFGYDTNVNASPSTSTIAVPQVNGTPLILALTSSSRATADWFSSIGGGINFSSPLTKSWSLFGGVAGSQRWNQDVSSTDLGAVDGNVGLMNVVGKNVYSMSAQYSTLRVANNGFRDAMGWSAQWQHNADARNQISLYLQYSDLDYSGQRIRNADRWVYGGAYAHAWREGLIAYISAYGVHEKAHDESRGKHLGFDGYGLRVGAQKPITQDLMLVGSVAYESRRHDAEDSVFLATRRDDQLMANVSLNYQIKRDLRLSVQYAHVDQRANLPLYAYDRNTVSVSLRQHF